MKELFLFICRIRGLMLQGEIHIYQALLQLRDEEIPLNQVVLCLKEVPLQELVK